MKIIKGLLSRLMTPGVRKVDKNKLSEMAALLVQKEMRAKDAEKKSIKILEEYSIYPLAKKYSELCTANRILKNENIDLRHCLKRAMKYLNECCKRRVKKINRLNREIRK